MLLEDSDGTCGFAGDHVTLTLTGMDMAHVNVGKIKYGSQLCQFKQGDSQKFILCPYVCTTSLYQC